MSEQHPDRPTPGHLPTAEESLADQTPGRPAADRERRPSAAPDAPEHETDLRESTPNSTGPQGASGGMGVSSERVGHSGPRQTSTDGLNPTGPAAGPGEDAPPEQSTGAPEDNPVGLEPKAGYPSTDPRSDAKPFQTRGNVQG